MPPKSSSPSSSAKKSIRPHRKSRNGCQNCKRRKVKCDEKKPCGSCISFGFSCDLAPGSAHLEHGIAPVPAPRRGRGRPRKIWTDADSPKTASPLSTTATTKPTPPASEIGSSVNVDVDVASTPAPLNLDHAELLTHFLTSAASSLPGADTPALHGFWTRTVPQLGVQHPFVLHLVLSTAAFHLAHLARQAKTSDDEEKTPPPPRLTHSAYLSQAHAHLTAGAAGFSARLARPDAVAADGSGGAMYLAAVLTSICTFAAGPAGRDDLLVCTVRGDDEDDDDDAAHCLPFVHGVRLMRESFDTDLGGSPGDDTGADETEPSPSSPSSTPHPRLQQPVCVRDGFARRDWEGAVDGLRVWVAARAAAGGPGVSRQGVVGEEQDTPMTSPPGADNDAAVSLRALDNLISIYEATYGRRRQGDGTDGEESEFTYDGPGEHQFVFGWLYRLEPSFAALVRRRDPCALLVLAYYAVLLGGEAVRHWWCVESWSGHIVARVGELVGGDVECEEWMQWPKAQVASGEGVV